MFMNFQCASKNRKPHIGKIFFLPFLFMLLFTCPVLIKAVNHSMIFETTLEDQTHSYELQNVSQKKVTITGYVFDNDKLPLHGTLVVEEGTSNAVTVGDDGSYSIEVIPKKGLTLLFSFFGMQTQTIEVHNQRVIDITLRPLEATLDEVVVTGYGNVLKEAYTGSAAIITEKDISNRAVSSFENLLGGLSPGLVSSGSGQPGEIAEIQMRGFGSMSSSNQPLYVIDGVIFDQDNTSGHSNVTSSPMATLNPSDIASITLLKDAASASLYGSQGANGVIVITTKQGVVADRIRYNFSAQAGVSQVFSNVKPKLVNAEQYRELWTEGEYHRMVQQSGTDDFIGELNNLYSDKIGYVSPHSGKNHHEWYKAAKDEFNKHYAIPKPDGSFENYDYWGADFDKMPNIDWYDQITRTAPFQKYDFSLSGGSPAIKYFMSLGYFDQQGIIINSGLKRYSLRVNLSSDDRNNFINWGANMNVSRTEQSGPLGTGTSHNMPHFAALLLPAVVPPYLEDGSYNFNFPNNLLNSTHNPIASAKENIRERPQFNMFASGWLRLNFNKGLDFRADVMQYYITGHRNDYFSKYFGSGIGSAGQLTVYDSKRIKTTSRNMLNFDYSFDAPHRRDAHRINGTVGVELIDFKQEWSSASAVGFINDEKPALSTGSEISGWSGSGYDYTLVSLISRADYSYRHRYFVGGSYRLDQSSRFSPDYRTGKFWSLSAAYRITNENWEWMRQLRRTVNNIKFKVSYGYNGTVPSKFYHWRTMFNGSTKYDNEHALYQPFRGTDDLRWEKNKILNVGVDVDVLQNRLRMTLEYYIRKSSDLLQDVPVSQTSGYSTMLMNTSAGISNKGLELDLKARIIDNLFKWDLGFNMAALSSKYYGLEQDLINGSFISRNGESVYSWYMYDFAGITEETGRPVFYGIDGTLSSQDNPSNRKIVGKGVPSITGGFTPSFSYQGWELSSLFSYGLGHDVLDVMGSSRSKIDGRSIDYNADVSQLDRWTPDHTSALNRIRINGQTSEGTSTRYLYKGDYLKLKNIKLQYVFPSRTFRNLGIAGSSVYAQVENLWVWTELDGYDPDMQSNSTRHPGRYPTATTYTLGINVNF